MTFRQESDEYEVWYTETDDSDERLKMKIFRRNTFINELSWWFQSVKDDGHYDARIHFIREHFD